MAWAAAKDPHAYVVSLLETLKEISLLAKGHSDRVADGKALCLIVACVLYT
jgi:hypothetical protein